MAIRRMLGRLPREQREVVVRRFFADQTFRAIAVELALTEGAVKMRFRRGLELLRALLLEEGHTL